MSRTDEEQTARANLAAAVRGTAKPPRTMSRIERCRLVAEQHSAMRIDGMLMDAQTANAIVTVHDALKPENQVKFCALDIRRMASIAWKLVSR